jgi:hypothetical protein
MRKLIFAAGYLMLAGYWFERCVDELAGPGLADEPAPGGTPGAELEPDTAK